MVTTKPVISDLIRTVGPSFLSDLPLFGDLDQHALVNFPRLTAENFIISPCGSIIQMIISIGSTTFMNVYQGL